MSKLLPLALVAFVTSLAAAADPPAPIDLWPGTAPGEKGNIGPEGPPPLKPGAKGPSKSITNVTKPTIAVYKPAKEIDTGAAIVIAPGGGYNVLAFEHEGTMVAEWLQSIGVTGVLLKYRVPRRPDQSKDAPPIGALQDAQRAISITRAKAGEWGIDPNRIGFIGFSAGGHLGAWVSTNSDKRSYEAVDVSDKASCRPDFAVLIYPGGVLQKENKALFRPEIRVAKDTPPTFLAVAVNDTGSFDGTLALMKALKDAGVKSEIHVYSDGGHGFGMRAGDKPHNAWPKRCEEWLRGEGLLTKK